VLSRDSGLVAAMSRTKTAYDLALRILEFRARSESELRQRLVQKGAPIDEIDDVIDRLREQKLVDDANFAREFARTKLLGAGASRRRIVQDLGRKGVPRETAEAAVDSLQDSDGIDLSAAIHRAAEKKWRTLAKLDDFTRRRRLFGFLARRGFNPDEIRAAMELLSA
jgi:regulatory protein